jgi:aminopeptidase-like protein
MPPKLKPGTLSTHVDTAAAGRQIYDLIARLYPVCRSLTGDGVRQTLAILNEYITLSISEVPTGTQVFDWTVPKEWNIRDAFVKDARGRKVIDFRKSNLHVVSYSIPIRAKMPLTELKNHLHTLPEHPDWIPHKTTYYKEDWGFCLAHRDYLDLEDGEYEVCIDSSLEDGHLTYGECLIPGDISDEVLFSCHVCHPSLCNDNLSGIGVATLLAEHLGRLPLRYSYRFLFLPATIGSITWLSRNENRLANVKHGLVLTCIGDPGQFTYKKSRSGNAEVDRACLHVLKQSGGQFEAREFYPYGYDERQYCSPGFNLPVGVLMRTAHGCFPEYHTSADNLDLVRPDALGASYQRCLEIIAVLEGNRCYRNLNPKCEPQLGRRGLYRLTGGRPSGPNHEQALLWVLNLSDGSHSLLEIAERSNLSFAAIRQAADVLQQHGLLEEAQGRSTLMHDRGSESHIPPPITNPAVGDRSLEEFSV